MRAAACRFGTATITVTMRECPPQLMEIASALRCARQERGITVREIAKVCGVPCTEAEHWFRTDGCGSIPSPESWPSLRDALRMDGRWDDRVMKQIERENSYDMSSRVYDIDYCAPTITCGNPALITIGGGR